MPKEHLKNTMVKNTMVENDNVEKDNETMTDVVVVPALLRVSGPEGSAQWSLQQAKLLSDHALETKVSALSHQLEMHTGSVDDTQSRKNMLTACLDVQEQRARQKSINEIASKVNNKKDERDRMVDGMTSKSSKKSTIKEEPARVVQPLDSDFVILWNYFMEKYPAANTELPMGIRLRRRMSPPRINSHNHKKLHQAIHQAHRSRDFTRVFEMLKKYHAFCKYGNQVLQDPSFTALVCNVDDLNTEGVNEVIDLSKEKKVIDLSAGEDMVAWVMGEESAMKPDADAVDLFSSKRKRGDAAIAMKPDPDAVKEEKKETKKGHKKQKRLHVQQNGKKRERDETNDVTESKQTKNNSMSSPSAGLPFQKSSSSSSSSTSKHKQSLNHSNEMVCDNVVRLANAKPMDPNSGAIVLSTRTVGQTTESVLQHLWCRETNGRCIQLSKSRFDEKKLLYDQDTGMRRLSDFLSQVLLTVEKEMTEPKADGRPATCDILKGSEGEKISNEKRRQRGCREIKGAVKKGSVLFSFSYFLL